jgi:hypothetical protein
MKQDEYCAQIDCIKRDKCRHYQKAKTMPPEKAFQQHAIEDRECGPLNGWVKYWPTDEAKK